MLLQEVGVGVTEMFTCACKPATWPLVILVTRLCNVLQKKKKKKKWNCMLAVYYVMWWWRFVTSSSSLVAIVDNVLLLC